MPSREKPEKHKPQKAQPDSAQPEPLRPGLERRLHTAKSTKSSQSKKSVAANALLEKTKTDSGIFTLVWLAVIEFEHVEKTLGKDEAARLQQAIESEIAAQLREDDLVASAGDGIYFIYLTETAKLESKMVLDRLSQQICKKNSQRPVLPQVSIKYKFVTAETMKAKLQNLISQEEFQDERLHSWLDRYRFSSPASIEKDAVLRAKDAWSNTEVVVRRFNIAPPVPGKTVDSAMAILSSIQQDGLALLPKLVDFFHHGRYVYLVLEPTFDCSEDYLETNKGIHSLAISICDLLLKFDSFSPPVVPPDLSALNFGKTTTGKEVVIDELESHLVKSMFSDVQHDSPSYSAFGKDLLGLFQKLSKNFSNDECFAETRKLIEKLVQSVPAKGKTSIDASQVKGTLQKIRAVFKRHEDKIRRSQSATSGVE